MFVVCKKLSNGLYKAVDTDDWTEEIISVFHLKLLESMGYSFIFDEKYDFISKLFLASIVTKASFDAMSGLGFFVPYHDKRYLDLYIRSEDNDAEAYCFVRKKDIVLFTIRRDGNSFKLFYKIHDGKILGKGKVEFSSMELWIFNSTRYKGGYFIELRYNFGDEESNIRFDLECNQIKDK